MSHMGPYRNEVSAFLHLIAEKLFAAAGPFGMDELDIARHESKCAARKLLTEKWHARDALAHIRGAVARRAECPTG